MLFMHALFASASILAPVQFIPRMTAITFFGWEKAVLNNPVHPPAGQTIKRHPSVLVYIHVHSFTHYVTHVTHKVTHVTHIPQAGHTQCSASCPINACGRAPLGLPGPGAVHPRGGGRRGDGRGLLQRCIARRVRRAVDGGGHWGLGGGEPPPDGVCRPRGCGGGGVGGDG